MGIAESLGVGLAVAVEDGLPHAWITRMKRAIGDLSPRFGTSRMVREYAERYYLAAGD